MKKLLIASIAAGAVFACLGGGVISVNIADGSSGLVQGAGLYGLAPAAGASWINVTETEPNPFTVAVTKEWRGESAASLSGVSAEFSSTGGFGRYKPDGVTVDDSAPFLKRYIDDAQGNITVTMTGIPYKSYRVYIYLGSDWGVDGADYHPVSVNGTWYGYSSADYTTVRCGKSDYWGEHGGGVAVEGVNTLCIPLQYGPELTFTIPGRWPCRSCLAAFQIAESDEPVVTPPGAISVNFGGSDYFVGSAGSLSGLAGGYVPAASWNNMEGASGTDVALSNVWDGVAFRTQTDAFADLRITWAGGSPYHDGDTSFDQFLRGFLQDNVANPPSVTVRGIPFKSYDLIVYMAADWNWAYYHPECENPDFRSVRVNGQSYTWDADSQTTVAGDAPWGLMRQPQARLGVNALRIVGLTSSELEFITGNQGENGRGNIAAFQIVKGNYIELTAEGDIDTKKINSMAGNAETVLLTVPSGTTVTLSHNVSLVCKQLKLISDGNVRIGTWNNLVPEDAAEVAKISAGQVKGNVYHSWKPTARAISLNFYSDKGTMAGGWEFAGALGADEIPACSWNDLINMEEHGIAPVVWDGTTLTTNVIEGLGMTWKYVGTWGWGSSSDNFRRGWIDANQGDWTVTVTNLPFAKYDVVFYCNWDGSHAFRAMKINGDYWTWDADKGEAVRGVQTSEWGESACEEPAIMGRNAMRVNGVTGSTLVLQGGYMCNICAIQILEYCPPPRERSKGFTITLE